jgi:hypothetical protein
VALAAAAALLAPPLLLLPASLLESEPMAIKQ